jgi:SAM-dependent methyltransferase
MRDHNKAFCRLVAETLHCPGPVFEFGSYQVEGQEGYANLRGLFPGKKFVGCDVRDGPGVDRVLDVTAIDLPDETVGTVLCIETFEHVFRLWDAFGEIYRVLQPGGVFIITAPLNFRIHAYPDDYWRMTPSCLRRLLFRYATRVSGFQGHRTFPHTVMGVAVKAPAPADTQARLEQLVAAYHAWLRQTEANLRLGTRLRRRLAQVYRSKGERNQIANYYVADFLIESDAVAEPHKARSPIPAAATT